MFQILARIAQRGPRARYGRAAFSLSSESYFAVAFFWAAQRRFWASESLRLLALLARLGLGLLLFYATICLLIALLRSPEVQQSLVAMGLLLGVLWILWSRLPEWFREAIRSFWKNRGSRED